MACIVGGMNTEKQKTEVKKMDDCRCRQQIEGYRRVCIKRQEEYNKITGKSSHRNKMINAEIEAIDTILNEVLRR